jgi:hypothetical protein
MVMFVICDVSLLNQASVRLDVLPVEETMMGTESKEVLFAATVDSVTATSGRGSRMVCLPVVVSEATPELAAAMVGWTLGRENRTGTEVNPCPVAYGLCTVRVAGMDRFLSAEDSRSLGNE